ncbi:hypothetical protein [Mycobacterium sp. 3519A]|uniref:hypothetical protein n=1 Tax=Mycobacterium sp. 3519A TaxID=2057184 RepID=UPI00115989B0|nr:hypothetical protein [Mycobacterium sp. 3519A]
MIWVGVLAIALCGCSSATAGQASASSDAPTRAATALASPMTDQTQPTAWTVVRGLSRAGLAATNPLDTTAGECPAAGCLQSVVTDQLRVKSFATPVQATRYATARGLQHAGTIAVAFAPPLSHTQRERYWAAIERLAAI